MGSPFYKGPLPPFIDQGGEGVTMWDKSLLPYVQFPVNNAHHPTALFFWFLLVAGILHDSVTRRAVDANWEG